MPQIEYKKDKTDNMDNKNIRLIALDLDGTVFDSDKNISKRTLDVIKRASESGIIILPASGRPLCGLPQNLMDVDGIDYALVSNGAVVFDMKAEGGPKPVFTDCISEEKAIEILDAAKYFESCVGFYQDGAAYSTRSGYERVISPQSNYPSWYKEYTLATRQPIEDMYELIRGKDHMLEKFTFSFENREEIGHAVDVLHTVKDVEIVLGNPFNVEVGVSDKGRSILEFAKIFGISRDQVMACGDFSNDLTMIKAAGFSVAMGNAVEELKAAADFVTLTNDEDGVAYAIEKFVRMQN